MINEHDIAGFKHMQLPEIGDWATVEVSPYISIQGRVVEVFPDGQVLAEGAEFPGFPITKE